MLMPIDLELKVCQHQWCFECVNASWFGAQNASTPAYSVLKKHQTWLIWFSQCVNALILLVLTHIENQIARCWRIMRTRSVGVTRFEHQIGWRWRILSTKSVGVDTFWAPNRLALTNSEHPYQLALTKIGGCIAREKLAFALYLWIGTENENFDFTLIISESHGYIYQKICFRNRVP